MIIYIIIILILTKIFISFNNIHPFLCFFNGILMHHCKNGPYFSEEEKLKLFPVSIELESNIHNIKNDYINYPKPLNTFNKMLPLFKVNNLSENDWKIIPLKTTGLIIHPNLQYFNSLKNIISHPSIHNAFFSILEPNSKIPPHIGPYKGYLRYHLGIIIPEENGKKPSIKINNIPYFWKEGEGVLFDDMFVHSVVNPTNQKRVVLFIDVIRPIDGIIGKINEMVIWLMEKNPKIKEIQKNQHQSIKI